MTDSEKTLSQYLKELRKSCGYSQEYVANQLNITRQTYSHYETGRISPPVNSLYNLAKLYGVPVENFMDLAVTYSINMDFAMQPPQSSHSIPDDLSLFLEYINEPSRNKKFKLLSRKERMLLYYFDQIDQRDQEDIISFLKIKFERKQKDDGE